MQSAESKRTLLWRSLPLFHRNNNPLFILRSIFLSSKTKDVGSCNYYVKCDNKINATTPIMKPSTRIWPKIVSVFLSALLALTITFRVSKADTKKSEQRPTMTTTTSDHAEEPNKHLLQHTEQPASTSSSFETIIECGIYLAPSSIPGSGLGMYAGNRTFRKNDIVTDEDIVIPIFEREWHSNVKGKFLWDEYIWNGDVSTQEPWRKDGKLPVAVANHT